MPMADPCHPGEIIRHECLAPLDLHVKGAARELGVSRQAFSNLLNARAGVSTSMAFRLSRVFGSTPETWLAMQTAYDLWQARERAKETRPA